MSFANYLDRIWAQFGHNYDPIWREIINFATYWSLEIKNNKRSRLGSVGKQCKPLFWYNSQGGYMVLDRAKLKIFSRKKVLNHSMILIPLWEMSARMSSRHSWKKSWPTSWDSKNTTKKPRLSMCFGMSKLVIFCFFRGWNSINRSYFFCKPLQRKARLSGVKGDNK